MAVAKSDARITKQAIDCCIVDLVEKIGDAKNGQNVKELLSMLAENSKLEYVSQVVIDTAFSHKSPKNQQEALAWLIQSIKDFGFK